MSSATPRPPAADSAALVAEGRTLHAPERLQDGFASCQRALALDAANAEAQHLRCVACAARGQPRIGRAVIRRAVASRPDAADFRVNLAAAHAELGQLDEAAREMASGCALAPGDVDGLAAPAALALRSGRNDEAGSRHGAAAALAPQRCDLHEVMAKLKYRRGALPEAMAGAARATALDPAVAQRISIGQVRLATKADRPPVAPLVGAEPHQPAHDVADACAERDLIVCDDFLADPHAARERALGLCAAARRSIVRGNSPGVQSVAQDCRATRQRIADALGQPLEWDSPDPGAVRGSLAADDGWADVRVDNSTLPNIFGGVLGLTLPEHCSGGTGFHRHRGTGWARRPDAARLRERGYASFLDFRKRNLPPNRQAFAQWRAQPDSTWARGFEVALRFNRLVAIRSDFLHAITEPFGDAPEYGSLVRFEAMDHG